MEKSTNKNKGITLIALIITVIVMLILAGVAISTLTGSNGLIAQVIGAGSKYKDAADLEESILNKLLSGNYAQGEPEKYYFEITLDTTKIDSLPFTTNVTAKNNNGKDYNNNDITFTIETDTDNYTLSESNLTKTLSGGSLQEENFEITFTDIKVEDAELGLVVNVTSPREEKIVKTINVDKPSQHIFNFNYTGNYQTFTAPSNGIYKIELWGAQGGKVNDSYPGYLGGYVSGNIKVEKGKEIYVYIGQEGQLGKSAWNGGAYSPNDTGYGAKNSGGGATDVRIVSGAWNDVNSLRTRLMVAGSGGAATSYIKYPTNVLGIGGGLTGGRTNDEYGRSGAGGSQTSGGIGGANGGFGSGAAGTFGSGGNGVSHAWGGGGGYYGGGGGSRASEADGSGGGGSSFISGHTGCVAITSQSNQSPKNGDVTGTTNNESSVHYSGYKFDNTKMIDGAGYNWTNQKETYIGMPSWDGTGTIVGNAGDGYAKITFMRY